MDIRAVSFVKLQIQTHSYCNSDCIMCPYGRVHKVLPQGIMDWSLFTKIIDEIVRFSTLKVITPMLQNEPLLHKRIIDEIKYIKEKRSDIEVSLNTNGDRLNDRMLTDLIDAGLDILVFSINALTEKTFERVQRGLNFKKVLANLTNLINNRPSHLTVIIKAMIIKENHFEFALRDKFEIIRLAKEKGIPIDLGPISNRAGSLASYKEQLIHEQRQSSKKKNYCDDIFKSINILYNGDVIICCVDWLRESVVGNVGDQPLVEVLTGQLMLDRKQKINEGRYKDMEPCRKCSQAWNIIQNLAEAKK